METQTPHSLLIATILQAAKSAGRFPGTWLIR